MYWFTGILGLLFAAAPFVLQYNDNQPALWTSLLVGAGIVLVSALEAIEQDKDALEYWGIIILGAVAVASPFLFGFDHVTEAMWTSVIAGGLMAVAAGGRLLVTSEPRYG